MPIGEAPQIVQALRRRGRPVEYLELGGEGHVFRRADSRKRVAAAMVRSSASTSSVSDVR